ncbi:MAG TPA: hypothetical protein VFT66_07155 [Roseiflexaceae bacterium]|nr:hypothetical protein [Roseiflexaceae bacterium]
MTDSFFRILRVVALIGIVLMVLVCVLLIYNGGSFDMNEFLRERAKPKLEPVENGTSQPGLVYVDFTANTNCAVVGETITMTVELANRTAGPLTLTNTPPVDIVITPQSGFNDPLYGPRPLRWSTTPNYPTNIAPLLQPGERRTYQWLWTVPPVYQTPVGGDVMVDLFVTSQAPGQSPQPDRVTLYLGIGSVAAGQARFPCAELRR